MQKLFELFWNEPRAPDAPGPLRRDWVLVSFFAIAAMIEGLVSEDIIWPALTITLTIALTLTLPWRRTQPLYMIAIAYGASALVQSFALARGVDWSGLDSNLFVVIFPYALLRWGSGREAITGVVIVALSVTIAMAAEQRTWLEVFGASLFLLLPATLGAAVRYQDAAQRRTNDQVRLREREQLARELHDTVAHHVSAIAIQAQAGQALAATQPQAPVEILGIIEEAASRTLNEMRHIVYMLRDDADPIQTPVARLVDIKRLAADKACPLNVNISFSGDLDKLNTAIESTLFRLTQEAITNAVRHARAARHVDVKLMGDMEKVDLSVVDDGEPITHNPPAGLGLRGMKERVELLGGRVSAAPAASGGWLVKASIPRFNSGKKL